METLRTLRLNVIESRLINEYHALSAAVWNLRFDAAAAANRGDMQALKGYKTKGDNLLWAVSALNKAFCKLYFQDEKRDDDGYISSTRVLFKELYEFLS